MIADSRFGRGGSVRALLLVGLGLALFATVTAGAGLLLWYEPHSSASTAEPPSAQLGALDEDSRTVTIGSASMVLPTKPYALYPDPMPLRGVLDGVFSASAAVHPRTADRSAWTAAVLIGRLPAVVDHDLATQGRTTLHQLSESIFDGHPTTVRRIEVVDRPVGSQPGVQVTARVAYAITGLPSRYDAVTVRLIGLDDGSAVVAVTSVPDDTPADIATQASDALGSLKVG